MPILIDFSQVSIAAISGVTTGKQAVPFSIEVARHVMLNAIRAARQKHRAEFGEIIICCDGKDYWRKKTFPYYKANRKKAREQSQLDWKLVHAAIDTVKKELDEHFPYKVVEVNGCEGDDVIAVLCKYFQHNELVTKNGPLYTEEVPQNILIVSADTDFLQLQKYRNVKQFSIKAGKLIACPKSPAAFLFEKIIRGDAGDGVPNILSKDDVFVTVKGRQTSIREEYVERVMELSYASNLEGEPEETMRNFNRNKLLIDFDYIPEEQETAILERYKSATVAPRYGLMKYFAEKELHILFSKMKEF